MKTSLGLSAPPLTDAEHKQSLWHRSLGHYRTPDGRIVPLWNGHMLYLSRNSAQQRAQAHIVKERAE